MPEVSVVMGVYNGERYLRSALDSVLAQQDVDLEFIVVDDGSTDATPRILAERSARDSRLRVLTRPNAGLTRALIAGCTAARGRFIARQDADDLSMPGRLRLQAQMLRTESGLSFVSSWAEVIGPEDEPLLLHTRPDTAAAATRLLVHGRSGPPGHGSVMMRRDAYERVGGYREKFYYAQDSDLWLRLAGVGELNYVPEVLYRYRVSAESISGRLHAHKLAYAQLIDELHAARQRGEDDGPMLAAATLPAPGTSAGPRPSSDTTNYFIGRCLVARRDPRARAYLRASLAGNPGNLRTWLLWSAAELAAPFWRVQGSGQQ
jgi:glycosyltransferase involved in cell wall biosynthesis